MSKAKLSNSGIVVLLVGVVALTVVSFFSFTDLQFLPDKQIDALLQDVIQRAALALFLIVFCCCSLNKSLLAFPMKNFGSQLLRLLPCLAVAVANFPFSAFARGAAVLDFPRYVWLFLIQCLLIGIVEEIIFRAIIQTFVFQKLVSKHLVWKVLASAAVFGLWHFVNLLFGAGIGSTLLQVGYSFLIGIMLSVLMYRTKNIWWCILVHALFDVGGTIVATLGHGNPWDAAFWTATIVCGIICAVWCVYEIFIVSIDSETKSDDANVLQNDGDVEQ